jgi:hypothetical protein
MAVPAPGRLAWILVPAMVHQVREHSRGNIPACPAAVLDYRRCRFAGSRTSDHGLVTLMLALRVFPH